MGRVDAFCFGATVNKGMISVFLSLFAGAKAVTFPPSDVIAPEVPEWTALFLNQQSIPNMAVNTAPLANPVWTPDYTRCVDSNDCSCMLTQGRSRTTTGLASTRLGFLLGSEAGATPKPRSWLLGRVRWSSPTRWQACTLRDT